MTTRRSLLRVHGRALTLAPVALALALGTLVSCTDRPQIWNASSRLLGPYRVGEQVLWIEATRGQVVALDPSPVTSGATPRVRALTIGRNALFATPSPSRARLLVLTGGKEALRTDQRPEAPTLLVIEPDAAGPRVVRRFELEAAFDRVTVSPDERWAVAHYSEQDAASAASSGQAVFRNPNEVALFDLEAEQGADNPTLRTLRSFGSAPLGVVFSPELAIPPKTGSKRTLALILARNYLTFVDMSHRERAEITVPLAPADAAKQVVPEQVLFAVDQATVFVRATGTADLFALTLESKKASSARENDFLPSINQPSSGRAVSDMILLDAASLGAPAGAGATRILAVNASHELSLIDAATSEFYTIAVGEPVDTIVPVPASRPRMVLLYHRATPRPRVHFLSLEKLDERRGANLLHRTLAKPVHQLLAVPGNQLALVVHNDARDVISLLDLVGEHHTDTPIQGRAQLHSYDFAGEDYLVGVTPGLARLGVLDLRNLHPLDLRLDHDPQRVIAVGEQLVIDHGSPAGLVTVVPRPDAAREQARVRWGFLIEGLLDRELED